MDVPQAPSTTWEWNPLTLLRHPLLGCLASSCLLLAATPWHQRGLSKPLGRGMSPVSVALAGFLNAHDYCSWQGHVPATTGNGSEEMEALLWRFLNPKPPMPTPLKWAPPLLSRPCASGPMSPRVGKAQECVLEPKPKGWGGSKSRAKSA